MGQLLIRNLDDAVIATIKRRASERGRSMEAEARDSLTRGTRLTATEKKALVREAWAESASLRVDGVTQTPGWQLIREDRDAR